jgi:hypothetical protein
MSLPASPLSTHSTRFGFHYFPDSLHYRESDLQTWIPTLLRLKASWLVCQSPLSRAIPEAFLATLVDAGIEPVIRFPITLNQNTNLSDLVTLMEAYARWGVRLILPFDRPNLRSAWPASSWAQQDLVERFTDHVLPVFTLALRSGLTPIFPPLEPGGNYWDTAFLRLSLESFERRKQFELLGRMGLSAYAWTKNRSLNWGAGGPSRWPDARPYTTPQNSQDHCGFRIFDWYQAIAKAAIQKPLPILLLGASLTDDDQRLSLPVDSARRQCDTMAIARLLAGEIVPDPENALINLEPIPAEVIGCAFHTLAESPKPISPLAWFDDEANPSPLAQSFLTWVEQLPISQSQSDSKKLEGNPRPLVHYLLLPTYTWGIADWHLDAIRPYVKRHRPTVGFSLEEAALAGKVTVIGDEQVFPEDELNRLRFNGCQVERLSGDGTILATLLAER